MSSSHNRNPTGKNQYGEVLGANDIKLQQALKEYHQQMFTDNKISELLKADHGIELKPRTVKKRRKQLGLLGSRSNMKKLPRKEAEQLVLDQMKANTNGGLRVRNIRHKIAMSTGQHITRDFVSEVIHAHHLRSDSKLRRATASCRGKGGVVELEQNRHKSCDVTTTPTLESETPEL